MIIGSKVNRVMIKFNSTPLFCSCIFIRHKLVDTFPCFFKMVKEIWFCVLLFKGKTHNISTKIFDLYRFILTILLPNALFSRFKKSFLIIILFYFSHRSYSALNDSFELVKLSHYVCKFTLPSAYLLKRLIDINLMNKTCFGGLGSFKAC